MKFQIINKMLYILITILFIIIGVVLDISNIHVPKGIDKIYHFIAFSIATYWALFLTRRFCSKKLFNRLIVVVLLFLGTFAAFTEKMQNTTAGRSCDPMDWLANIAGITVAGIIFYLINIRINYLHNEE